MKKKLFISAFNIHQGGGLYLLSSLIKELALDQGSLLILDKRLSDNTSFIGRHGVKWVKPTIVERLNVNWWLAKNVNHSDIVLCLGSLPPLINLRSRVIVFVQNRYLIERVPLRDFLIKDRLRLIFERLWFLIGAKNVTEFIVQTPTMKRLLEQKIGNGAQVRICPFIVDPGRYQRKSLEAGSPLNKVYDFVYVASGEPHKNHFKLLEAWVLLAHDGIYPSLCLTLDDAHSNEVCMKLEYLSRRHGLRIKNVGALSHMDVLELYKKSGAVIYPSNFESLGLPLIEARQAGLPVLAPELDYVRDVLDPEQVFNPDSSLSIARAVKRFIGISEEPLDLIAASDFLNMLQGEET